MDMQDLRSSGACNSKGLKLMLLFPQDVDKTYFYGKYVRVGSEFRILDAMTISVADHRHMIRDGEEVTSAAYFKIKNGKLEVEDWSSTLMIGPAADDETLLTNLLLGGNDGSEGS